VTILETIESLEVSTHISPLDPTFSSELPHYFHVGKTSIAAIIAAVNLRMAYPGGDRPIQGYSIMLAAMGVPPVGLEPHFRKPRSILPTATRKL